MVRLSAVAFSAWLLAQTLVSVLPGATTTTALRSGIVGVTSAATETGEAPLDIASGGTGPSSTAPDLSDGSAENTGTCDLIPMTTHEEQHLLDAVHVEYDFALRVLTGAPDSNSAVYQERACEAATRFCNGNRSVADIMRFTSELAWARAMYLDALFRHAAGGEVADMTEDQSLALWSAAATDLSELVGEAARLREHAASLKYEAEPAVPEAVRRALAPKAGRSITKRG